MGEAGSFTCQTAPGQLFATVDELKAHYKTDWHRYNLKRKARGRLCSRLQRPRSDECAVLQVVGLPMVGRDLFERVVSHAINAEEAAVDRATSTAHLKADKQRRPPRCAANPKATAPRGTHCTALPHSSRVVSSRALQAAHDSSRSRMTTGVNERKAWRRPWAPVVTSPDNCAVLRRNSDSEDDDDWEEVHGDEAEQVIQQLQQRRGARGDQAAPMADDCSSESSDTEMGDRELSADTHIALAGNGVELARGIAACEQGCAMRSQSCHCAGCGPSHFGRA